MVIFNEKMHGSHDEWLQTHAGRYIDRREKKLIIDLVAPREGERLLDVGCGAGDHLLFFRRKGCDVTGLERSSFMLDMARKKLGQRAALHIGKAEDMPFSDNEFDIVTIISPFCEVTVDFQQVIREAVRVCRGRVFIGWLNKYSMIGVHRRVKGIFSCTTYNNARFLSIWNMTYMIRKVVGNVNIRWGSVIFLPPGCYPSKAGLERLIPTERNPFGAFLCLSFPVIFSHRTIQDVIKNRIGAGVKERSKVHGAVREVRK